MSAARAVDRAEPGARGALAASLAAVAESGIIFIPVAVALRGSAVKGSGGPLGSYPAFMVLFALGVAAATAGRRFRWFGPASVAVAVAAGLVQSLEFGSSRPSSVVFATALALVVVLRAVMLALRDWRDPIQASFGWGAGVLLVEVLVAAREGWGPFLAVIVPVFFVASLASRAASLRLAEGVEAVGKTSVPWFSLGGVLAGVVVALGTAAAFLGGQGGLLERLGRIIPLALSSIILGLTFVVAQILKPVGWVLHALGFNRPDLSSVFARLRRTAHGLQQTFSSSSHTGLVQRLLGLAALAAVVFLLAWLVLRQRRFFAERRRLLPELVEPTPAPPPPVRSRHRERVRRRRELPQDTVRRWYAEILLEMERTGSPRTPWQTPGEYLAATGDSLPASAGSFTALTRAYEDVRYGRRPVAPADLDRLEAHRGMVLQELREKR